MKRTPRKPRPVPARDPLFNSSVQKALAMLETFGGERRALSLAELAAGVGMTTSSAQRCTHTLVRLGFLSRDPRARRWVLTPRALSLAHAYLAGHARRGRTRSVTAATLPLPPRCWGRTASRSPP